MRREIPDLRFLVDMRRSPFLPSKRNRAIVLSAATGHKPIFRLAEVDDAEARDDALLDLACPELCGECL